MRVHERLSLYCVKKMLVNVKKASTQVLFVIQHRFAVQRRDMADRDGRRHARAEGPVGGTQQPLPQTENWEDTLAVDSHSVPPSPKRVARRVPFMQSPMQLYLLYYYDAQQLGLQQESASTVTAGHQVSFSLDLNGDYTFADADYAYLTLRCPVFVCRNVSTRRDDE